MKLLNDKRAFVDTEIIMSAGFVILAGMAIVATIAGYIWGKKMGWGSFPAWQLLVIIVVELIAAYVIAARG